MRRLITLRTETGKRVFVHLDNVGSGIDKLYRRWTREGNGWRCVDSGEFAQLSGLIFRRVRKTPIQGWRV